MLPCVYFEILYFELLDPEILTNNTQNTFGENVDPKTVILEGAHELREALVCAFIEG